MKTYWRSALFRAVFGVPLGVTAGLLHLMRSDAPLLASVIPAGLYGALVMGATVVYDIETWSLTRSTICHLLITLAGFCALGLVQRWLADVPLWMPIAFLAVYFFIWLIQWGICYQRVRCMNRALRSRRSKGIGINDGG